jgi:hypothetical protein
VTWHPGRTRGPRRLIAAYYPGTRGQDVELSCGHTVQRRRVLPRQTETTCELCRDAYEQLDRAIAKASRYKLSADASDRRA